MAVRFLRMLALSMGFAGWFVVAVVFYWVEANNGQALIHNNRVWPRYEPLADMAAIGLAFLIIFAALAYEVVAHLRNR